ncbi:D-alanine--D-alanine ligase [Saccharobesus litoralis]|uniref:D-alanine--D-alanine ligase n=1 Tax=Saccharobesus litoralis TaxID=2172099 RepID=A0A2S0VX14_9ALTE|nr:D-alanine--D-alanine ligase [Saccharobesus litoralis]AWB68738.1 D-alanine--D-alanine ligase [Saccharobesus litoralis]
MSEKFGKVAVLYGGTSAERDVSIKSGTAVHQALISVGVDAHLFDTQQISPLKLKELGFERVFNALHGRGGEDGVIQGVLEYLQIPYAGSRVLGSALSMDKILTKQVWQSAGLPTAKFVMVKREQVAGVDYQAILERLNGKVFIKPAKEGSSIGMSMADTAVGLKSALEKAADYDCDILVEQFINGPEYTVAILAQESLPSISMQTPHEFYDYEAKYLANSTQYFCPSGLNEADEAHIQALAKQAFAAVSAEGWGRVDVMRDQDGQFYLLEANTVPGMTEKSLVPMAAKAKGIDFAELVCRILDSAK